MRFPIPAVLVLVAANMGLCIPVPAAAQTPPSLEELSFSTLLREAEGGDANTQNILGDMYSGGIGVARDYAEAIKWYRQSAEQGNDRGQFGLAGMYAEGHGVFQNHAEAIRWYLLSAEQGNRDAQGMLGRMHDEGTGVAQDLVQARMWYIIAGANGKKDVKDALERVSGLMSETQLDESGKLAEEWMEKHPSSHPGGYYWEVWEDAPPPVIIR